MKQKLPSFQFYPGDWLKDPALRACSPAARGVWIDMLCLMHESQNRGVLRANFRAISIKILSKSIAGCTPKLIRELIENGVVRVARKDGALYSKRLIRDELHRRHKSINGRKGGKQTRSKPEANPQAKKGSSSSSSSSSSKRSKNNSPRNEFADVFKNSFDSRWPEKYVWLQADFVQLAKWRKNYPDVTPKKFVAVAGHHWGRGEYLPKASLTIRGLCAGWAQLANQADAKTKQPPPPDPEAINGF